jgi:hypothetical protein
MTLQGEGSQKLRGMGSSAGIMNHRNVSADVLFRCSSVALGRQGVAQSVQRCAIHHQPAKYPGESAVPPVGRLRRRRRTKGGSVSLRRQARRAIDGRNQAEAACVGARAERLPPIRSSPGAPFTAGSERL